MKATPLKNMQEPHLKVIKNTSKGKKSVESNKLIINTLMPNFKYTNSNGELVTPLNHVHL